MNFVFFQNWIVTANADGSIPLNAKIVCGLAEINHQLLAVLLAQANGHRLDFGDKLADLSKVAEAVNRIDIKANT